MSMTNANAFDVSLLGKVATYTEILAKDAHSTAFVPLSDAYRQMGLLDDALEVAETGVKAQPRFSPGYVMLGRIQFELGNIATAEGVFEKACLLDPENLAAIKGLARAVARLGKPGRARELLEKALLLNPNDAASVKMLSLLPSKPEIQGNSAEPIKAKEPIATSTLAEIYLKQGFPDQALKVYLNLLESHPDNLDLRNKVNDLTRQIERNGRAESTKNETGLPMVEPQVFLSTNSASVGSPVSTSNESKITISDRQIDLLNGLLTSIEGRKQHVR